MGLIDYTNIEDGNPVTANVFNQRFGKIVSTINGGLDASNFANGGIPVEAISIAVYSKMWPIGSIYMNATNNSNPLALLGFGTWVAYGAGQVPVGIDVAQTEFNAPGKTGGTKTETLAIGQIPSHNHGVSDPGHNHGTVGDPVYTSASGNSRAVGGAGQQLQWSIGGNLPSGTGISIQNNGGGGSHNNLQPYVTVYMWQRTG